ncbi:MAG: MFS transporter [Liquorilactobacillus ghanensis]|uniref:MFS transporter n=1 Tax=Liquorilactobacillus ghanensis TaxID=399370 RepID=UPI0039EAA123
MKHNYLKMGGLTALILIMFIVTLDSTITNIALPAITSDFSSTLTDSNWVSTVYMLTLSVFMIPGAKFADQFGRKKLTTLGLLTFGIGSLMSGLAASLKLLVVARIIQGLGGAIISPVTVALAVSLFGNRQKAQGSIGIIGAAAALAAASGPAIGGLLIHYWSWRLIFFINVPLVLLALFLLNSCFKESYDLSVSKKIDYFGITLLSFGLFLITFVLLKASDYGWSSMKILLMIVGASLSLAIFLLIEPKQEAPLLDFSLFKNKSFVASLLIYMACGFTIICSSVVFNFFLEDILNYSTLKSGYIIMFSSLMVMVVVPIGNKFGQQNGYHWPIVLGTISMTTSLLLLANINYHSTLFDMIFAMVILGMGFGLAGLSQISAVLHIPAQKVNLASGIINAGRQLGSCLGIALLVGLLNGNLKTATQTIRHDAIISVNQAQLSKVVKQSALAKIKSEVYYSGQLKHHNFNMASLKSVASKPQNLPCPKKGTSEYKLFISGKQFSKIEKKLAKKSTDLKTAANLMQLSKKQQQISEKIMLESQAKELNQVAHQIKDDKNEQLVKAFKKTFYVGMLILIFSIPAAFYTDVKVKSKIGPKI